LFVRRGSLRRQVRAQMGLALEPLLALKAFHIGTAASVSVNCATALSMLNSAVAQLQMRADPESKLRLAFYLATRSELQRGTVDSAADRIAVKDISHELGSTFFSWFMRIEEATTSRTGEKWSGSTSPYSNGGGTDADPDNSYISPVGRMLRAAQAIGISPHDLTSKDRVFLEHATLRQMLDKHQVRHEP
jgi:hypothetical protein